MGRLSKLKWDKSFSIRPAHNIISSDFPKYVPQSWKFMEGKPDISLLLSYEYQRMWIKERDEWNYQMYYEKKAADNVDLVKKYVLSFKDYQRPPKPEKKKVFKIKKYEGIEKSFSTKRPPGDKAMSFIKTSKSDETRQADKSAS